MLERARDANKNRRAFYQNLIGTHAANVVAGIAHASLEAHDFDTSTFETYFPDYFEAGKNIGDIDEERLMIIGAMCLAYVNTPEIDPAFKLDALEVGVSALFEAMILQSMQNHNDSATADERIEIVEVCHELLEVAASMVDGDPERLHRIRLRQAFKRVDIDIVCGVITPSTLEDIREQLMVRLDATYAIPDYTARYGLIGEIQTLRHYWSEYREKGHHVAIPSTVRGGSGQSNAEQTHDLDIIRQRNDGSWIVLTPVEVKNTELTQAIRDRYTGARLAHFDSKTGRVHVSGEHRKPNIA